LRCNAQIFNDQGQHRTLDHRIGYVGPCEASLDVLREITRRHAMTIPFENLAVLVNGAPDLDLAAIEAKLVHAGRGGYCYEQNALLLAVLERVGFKVKGLSARVRYGIPPEVLTPRSHMLIAVETPAGPAFADAGFGGLTLTAPVMLRWREEQATPHEPVRLVPADEDHLLQARVGGEWMDVYRFDLAKQIAPDYEQQNWHTVARRNALFANNVVAAMPHADGRYAMFNRTLTWRPLVGPKKQHTAASPEEMRSLLGKHFWIDPSPEELERAWEVSGRATALHAGFS
jgi:N-hydroxyarylamine O-acetyltransferase